VAKSTTAAAMLADIAHARRDKLDQYIEADPKRAAVFWEFFDGAYAAKIPLSAAEARWVKDYGQLPFSSSHLRNVLSARHQKRG
jgi:hypothetical protein